MKIAIMGSGGVGGLFGAHLVRGGADVTFIARGAHLAAMRANGILIEGAPGGDVHVPHVQATDDPASLGPVDLVLFAVKLGATAAAIEAIRPLVGPDTGIVSFQNGVLKDDYLRAAFDEKHVFGGVGYVGSAIDRPGVIKQAGTLQRLVFGEFDGRRSSRVEAFLAACRAGGINAEIADDISRAIWEKFVFLVGLSGTTATMRVPIGPIRANPQTRALLLDLMREVVAVGRLARLGVFRRLGRVDRAAVTDAVEAVGLVDRLDDPVASLSGGQQRRVLVARALAAEPELLIMDEPTAGVDAANQEALAAVLTRISAAGTTLVVVTHETAPLAGVLRRAIVVDHGRVASDGPLEQAAAHEEPGMHHHHPPVPRASGYRQDQPRVTTGPRHHGDEQR